MDNSRAFEGYDQWKTAAPEQMDELEARTEKARQALDDIEATLATLAKLVKDIETSLCTDRDVIALYDASADLDSVENELADLCAAHNEQAEEAL